MNYQDIFNRNKQVLIDALRELGKSFEELSIPLTRLVSSNQQKKSKNQKTKKGSNHQKGHQFKSRQILPITPAQYRRMHMKNKEKAQSKKIKSERKLWKLAPSTRLSNRSEERWTEIAQQY